MGTSFPGFLTDMEPHEWRIDRLCAPAVDALTRQPVAPRGWFVAGNGLALALTIDGAPDAAAELMEFSIGLANELAEIDAAAIQYGVESWMNRIDLVRSENVARAERAYRSCYDLVLGRAVHRADLFGLHTTRINAASRDVALPALAILRYRSQAGLLSLYLGSGKTSLAAAFARRVVADFPRSVVAGMLQPAEVLAVLDPEAAFLRRFDVDDPRTEGDFVILLRTLGGGKHEAAPHRAGEDNPFPAALRRFADKHDFRNPRTPLLWSVYEAVASGADRQTLMSRVCVAADACRRAADRRLYRNIAQIAAPGITLPPFPEERQASRATDPRRLLPRLIAASGCLHDHVATYGIDPPGRPR